MKKLLLRKTIAVLLSVAMMLTVIPITTWAESPTDQPTEIQTADDEITEVYIRAEAAERHEENARHFLASDGSYQAYLYPYTVNYKTEDGYKEIDNSLTETKDGYYTNTDNPFDIRLPKTLSEKAPVKIAFGDYSVSWSFDAAESEAKIRNQKEQAEEEHSQKLKEAKDNKEINQANDEYLVNNGKAVATAEYAGVYDHIDIRYDLIGEQLKESIVLNEETKKSSFSFQVSSDGLAPMLNEDRSLTFADESGNTVFSMPAPYMFDASGEISQDVEVSLTESDTGYIYTLTPNQDWLADASRVYPVTIDPTIVKQTEYTATVYDTTVYSQFPTSNYYNVEYLRVGLTGTSGNRIRSLIKFGNLPALPSTANVVKATMCLGTYNYTGITNSYSLSPQIDVHEMTISWTSSSLTWNTLWASNTSYGYNNTITDYQIVNSTNWYYWDITNIAAKWYRGETNNGVMLKLHDEGYGNYKSIMFFSSDYYQTGYRPVFAVTYRDSKGLEDYWDYQTQSVGRAGTGYINSYTGNLVFVHNDVTVDGVFPFSVQHVYNGANVMTTQAYESQNVQYYYGNGWNLNMVQTLKMTQNPDHPSQQIEHFPWVYTDGDGTEHYFYQESNNSTITDEDGLGYVLSTISESIDSGAATLTKQIKTKDDTLLKFDNSGYLRRIVDSNGNTVLLNYSYSNGKSKRLQTITCNGKTVILSYDTAGRLIGVVDPTDRMTLISYDSAERLTTITYPDGYNVTYTYDGYNLMNVVSDIDQPGLGRYKVDYDTATAGSRNRVTKAVEYVGTAAGNGITGIAYSQNQTVFTDNKGRTTTYQFDTFGRTTCIYDDQNNIYTQNYTSSSGGSFKNNKIALTSSTVAYVHNRLRNPAFNYDLSNWTQMKGESSATIALSASPKLIARKSVKIEKSTTEQYAVIAQVPSLTAGQTYTFSGYLRTENVVSSTHGACLEVVLNTPSGSKKHYSDRLVGTTDTSVDNGFQKVSVTFTLNAGDSVARVTAGLFNASGTVYVDALQLEEGDTANQINLLDNAEFEYNSGSGTSPSNWAPSYSNMSASGVTTTTVKNGSWGYTIGGVATENRYILQAPALSGNAGDVYSVGAWAKANSVPDRSDSTVFKLVVGVSNTDGTTDWFGYVYNTRVTDWQFGMITVVTKKAYSTIQVYLCYYKGCNTATFDSVFLYRDTAQSYTYDNDGNVISASDNAKQETQYQYHNNSLAKILNPTGTCYEYGYDGNKNLKFSKSSEGLHTTISYDQYGNPIQSNTSSSSHSSSLQSGKTYYIRLRGSGKYLTVENAGTTSGTNVIQADFNGSQSQKWELVKNINGRYSLYPKNAPGMALDIFMAFDDPLTNVQIYTINDTAAQSFSFKPLSNYSYAVTPLSSPTEKVLTVNFSNTQDNVTIHAEQGAENADQSWYFEEAVDNSGMQFEDGAVYMFMARNSGKYFQVANNSTEVGSSVDQFTLNYGDSQKFRLNRYGQTNYYTLTPLHAPNRLVQVSTDIEQYGYNYLQLGDSTVTDRKLFKFQYDSQFNGYYIIPKHDETLSGDVASFSVSDGANIIFTGVFSAKNKVFIPEKISDCITSSATYQDNGNYLETVTDSRGNTTTYGYNTTKGLQTSVTDPNGTVTNYSYNANSDKLTGVSSGTSSVTYDYTGDNLTTITSPSGTVYGFTFDGFGNRLTTTVGNRTLMTNTYAPNNGNLTQSTYGNGATVNYTYDSLDRVTSKSYNNSEAVSYTYDKAGNLAQKTDSLSGTTTRYHYDLTGRTIGITADDGSSLNYVYDSFNRVLQISIGLNGTANTTSYVYGDTNISGQKVDLVYGVKQNGSQTLSYGYDSLSRLQTKTINTTTPFTTSYTYLEGANTGTTTTLVKTAQIGSDLYEYTYDALGNITTVEKNGNVVESYEYDSFSQLTKATIVASVSYASGVYEYTYDNAGNLLTAAKEGSDTITYGYTDSEWKDLLTSLYSSPISYDAIGNPLTYRGITLTWQNGRQLASYGNVSFTYDADGHRISKTTHGVTTEYYWIGDRLIGEKTGNTTIDYLYDENGSIYAFEYNGTRYYYVFNIQGDVIEILNSAGTSVVQYMYDPWGRTLWFLGSEADTIGERNHIRYRGYYYDNDIGFYYLNTRYYDPSTGRFINADGYISTGDGLLDTNMFAYCGNNAVMFSDPSGQVLVASIITAAFGFLLCATAAVLTYQVLTNPTVQEGIGRAVDATVAGVQNAVSSVSTIFANKKTKNETKVKEKDITIPSKPKKQAYFTINPYDFKPNGLVMIEHPGTNNGRIIEWRDPVRQVKIFEWDEDFKHGAHYHSMLLEWDGNHMGTHYLPGTPVPEPWNTFYFGG